MDVDLQDPPELIRDMYQKLITYKLNIVYAQRKKSYEIHRKYRNIFETFLSDKSKKCPEGFKFNETLGECVPIGPKLSNLDFPLEGEYKK